MLQQLLLSCLFLGLANSHEASGLFSREGSQVPLKSVKVSSTIVDFLSQVELSQTYSNDLDVPIEAVYKFPLDEKAAITDFTATIGERVLRGISKRKETARQEYEEAIQKGQTAFLFESDNPETFIATLGNIPPKTIVVITLSYVTELATGTFLSFLVLLLFLFHYCFLTFMVLLMFPS